MIIIIIIINIIIIIITLWFFQSFYLSTKYEPRGGETQKEAEEHLWDQDMLVVCCIGFENILIGYPSTRPIREPRPFQVMLLEFINLLKASARTQSEYSRTSHTNMTREDFLCSSASPLKKTEDSVIHSVQNEMATGQVSIIISARNPKTLAKTYTNVRSFKLNIHNVFFLMRDKFC